MKKRAMQRNNRETIRQKSNSHTFVDDADFFITRHTPHCGDVHRRLHNKESKLFRTVWAVLAIVFWYFVKNLCGKWLICISETELYVILSINGMEKKIIRLGILFVFG